MPISPFYLIRANLENYVKQHEIIWKWQKSDPNFLRINSGKGIFFFQGKDAKYAERISDDDGQEVIKCHGSENYWQKEVNIPVHQSIFNISEQPFSALNATLLPDSFAETSTM